jgi:hypothetical protein
LHTYQGWNDSRLVYGDLKEFVDAARSHFKSPQDREPHIRVMQKVAPSAPSCWRTPSLLLRNSESHATWRRKARHCGEKPANGPRSV